VFVAFLLLQIIFFLGIMLIEDLAVLKSIFKKIFFQKIFL